MASPKQVCKLALQFADNACTQVPTVFLENSKTKMHFNFQFPKNCKWKFDINFQFSIFTENENWNLDANFHILIFWFQSRALFLISGTCKSSLERTKTGRQRKNNENQQFWCQISKWQRFLLADKNFSHGEIKSHLPDFKGCSLQSLKTFCTQHRMEKQMRVSDDQWWGNRCCRTKCYFRSKPSSVYSVLSRVVLKGLLYIIIYVWRRNINLI